jgi:hypothetical protein
MVSRCRMALATGMLLVGTLLSAAALAQWRVTQETPSGSERRIDVALVDNESGHELRLFNDDAQYLHGIFTIRGGFDTIDPRVCPTYRVDEREPKRVTFADARCRIQPKSVEFTLGAAGDLDDRELRRLMNGSNLVFRYRLGGGNYRETQFTLRGSKYALTTALEDVYLGFDE